MDIRDEFEKVDEIKTALEKYDGYRVGNKYSTYDTRATAWLNGAWYAFQEQQKKIDAIKSKLSDIYDASDEDETVAHLLDEIQEFLK